MPWGRANHPMDEGKHVMVCSGIGGYGIPQIDPNCQCDGANEAPSGTLPDKAILKPLRFDLEPSKSKPGQMQAAGDGHRLAVCCHR